jgi:hypothetical protein
LGFPHWSELEDIDPADLPTGLDDPETVHEVISEICNVNSRIGDLVVLCTSLHGRMAVNKHTQPIVEDLDALVQATSLANSELASKLAALIETRNPAEVFACLEYARGAAHTFEDEYQDVAHKGEKWATPLELLQPEAVAPEAVAPASDDDKPLDHLQLDRGDSDIDEDKLFANRKSAKRSGAPDGAVKKRKRKQ